MGEDPITPLREPPVRGVEAVNGGIVVHLAGELDLYNADEVRDALGEAIAGSPARIVVDMEQTTFLDSSGLGALIAGLKSARQAGGDLRVARPTEAVRTVFSLTNLDRVLKPRDSVDGAFDD